jgi:phospholipid/cholesterol/gamma-HCH transport system permease protein
MPSSAPAGTTASTLATQPVLRWFVGWWRVLRFAALMLALAGSPGSYREGRWAIVANHLVRGVGGALGWFTLIAALMTLVITRIVLVTAFSYGLSQYALEMVIRVLVLELIPLAAACFVAVRGALPAGAEITTMRRRGELDALRRAGRDPLQHELLPRALASLFLVLMLAVAAGLVALVLAYLVAYGFSPWGLAGYTRTVGGVMSPPVALVFTLKTALFAAAVAVLPLVSAMADSPVRRTRSGPELRGLLRMLAVMVLIELGSLSVNYI